MTEQECAVVTGAAQGIGAATAKKLSANGFAVALLDINGERCAPVLDEIAAAGGTAIALSCDVRSDDSVSAAITEAFDRFGRIDALVNNAGVIRDNLIHKMSEEDWDFVIDTHLKGMFLCTRATQVHMVNARRGKIVNVSSTSALGNRGQANYSAAKAGVQGFTKTLAMELGPFNINVNAVAPGYIDTAMTAAVAERLGVNFEERKALAAQSIPLRRIGTPGDVANVIDFLVSDASSYVSGQTLYINGGNR